MKPLKSIISAISLILIFIFSISCKDNQQEIPWTNLINDNSLEGWNIKGGKATFKVEHGVITGTTSANTPNTFLTTDKIYGDFIFEIEFKVDSTMNSVEASSMFKESYKNRSFVFPDFRLESPPS